MTFDSKTINLLAYFIECSKIFDYINKKFQDDEYYNLPQAVPLYYLIGHYHKTCLNVSTVKNIPNPLAFCPLMKSILFLKLLTIRTFAIKIIYHTFKLFHHITC